MEITKFKYPNIAPSVTPALTLLQDECNLFETTRYF